MNAKRKKKCEISHKKQRKVTIKNKYFAMLLMMIPVVLDDLWGLLSFHPFHDDNANEVEGWLTCSQ